MAAQDAAAKAQAVRALLALPEDQQNDPVALLLADLGANHEALQIEARLASRDYPGPSILVREHAAFYAIRVSPPLQNSSAS